MSTVLAAASSTPTPSDTTFANAHPSYLCLLLRHPLSR
jgi:hypothetical protein